MSNKQTFESLVKPETRTILHGDILEQIQRIPDESIDCVITSPPYWGLRDYGEKGQWGMEHDFKEWLFKMKMAMRQIRRVLKKSGSCWVNMGDTYGGSTMHSDFSNIDKRFDSKNFHRQRFKSKIIKPKPKSRLGIPARFMIQCIDDVVHHPETGEILEDYSWILRNDIIWQKPNAMPNSVKDRFTNRFEYVYFFTKNEKYYFDLDSVREKCKTEFQTFNLRVRDSHKPKYSQKSTPREEQLKQDNVIDPRTGRPKANYKGFNERWRMAVNEGRKESSYRTQSKLRDASKLPRGALMNPKGKNPGDIFTITVKPFRDAHFATFPPELPEKIIKCACPKEGIVLDPFLGSGTVGLAAERLDRKWMGIEMKPEYCDLAIKRIGVDGIKIV